jgi:hypothetical protein
MNRFQRHASKHAYYSYLQQYSPAFLRRYTSERYYKVGRRGLWQNLVMRFSCNLGKNEEEITGKYRMPVPVAQLLHRLSFLLLTIPLVTMVLGLGNMGLYFTQSEGWGYQLKPRDNPLTPTRYE